MSDYPYDLFNLIANIATVAGVVVALYILVSNRRITINVRRIAEQLAQVIAPKTGIESYLNLCAQVVDSDPDGTCVVTDQGKIVLVNRKMEDISGYHRSELMGQPVEILVPLESRRAHTTDRENYIDQPSLRPMRGLQLRHKRGRIVPVEIWLNNFKDSSGGFTIAKVRVPER